MGKQILEGVKILDFTTMIAAPIGTSFLAEFGADVIHVEGRTSMDAMRKGGPAKDGVRIYPKLLQRNKKCVTLDFHHPEAAEIFYKLVEWADVVVTNFRPSALKKFHIDYEDCVAHNKEIIYAHLSAYGRTGPYAEKGGFARVSEAFSGLTYITGWPDRAPTLSGSWIVDGIAGIHLAYSVMLAVYHKKMTGEGQLVDLALYEPLWRIMDELCSQYSVFGFVKERAGNMQSSVVPNNMYQAKDGGYVVLPVNGNHFPRLLKAMDRMDLMEDERFATPDARVLNREVVDGTVADWIAQYDTKECLKLLEKYDVPSGPVYSIKDIFEDAQFKAREAIINVYDPEIGIEIGQPGIFPKMSKTPGEIRWSGPKLGENNQEIFGSLLGMTEEEIRRLEELGAI